MINDYCSLNSTTLQEDIFATAPCFTKLLLVEYNFPWADDPFTKNLLPQEVNDYLQHFKKASKSNRVLFIKNKQKANLQINIFAINNLWEKPYTNHFILTDHKELLNFSETVLFSQTHENKFPELIYLVCTNGKRDKCCSKFGVPVFKQLSQLAGHVWECTHVGGDRFAPNVLALPYCIFYGALTMEELPALVEHTNEQKIFLKKCRGRSCSAFIEQAAEYYLRKQQNNLNIFDLQVLSSMQTSPEHFVVEFRNTKTEALKQIKIKRAKALIKRRLTCNSANEEYPLSYHLIEN